MIFRKRAAAPTTAPDSSAALDTAWKIHAAQVDWTGKVDTKASFAFALESAAIATTIALTAQGRVFSTFPSPLEAWLYWIGLVGLGVAAFFALSVVAPRLRGGMAKKAADENFIYFGHARHWDANDLATALAERDVLQVVTRQITAMAQIAWRKHIWVQWSLWVAAGSALILVASGLLIRFHQLADNVVQ